MTTATIHTIEALEINEQRITPGRRIRYTEGQCNAEGIGTVAFVSERTRWTGPSLTILIDDGRIFRDITQSDFQGPGHRFELLDDSIPMPDGRCQVAQVETQQLRARVEADQKELDRWNAELGGDEKIITAGDGEMLLTIRAYRDDSDSQSDYFCGHYGVSNPYAIGIVKGRTRRESAARKAIAGVPEFEALRWDWEKEDYSMGHGLFLQSTVVGSLGEEVETYSGLTAPPYWYEIQYGQASFAPASKWYKG